MYIVCDWSDGISTKYKKAWELFEAQEYEKSAQALISDLEKNPDKQGFYALGQCYFALQDYDQAIESLAAAANMDTSYHQVYALLGDAFFLYSFAIERQRVFDCYMQAMFLDPSSDDYKQRLVNAVSIHRFDGVSENMKRALTLCMRSLRVDCSGLGGAWLSVVEKDISVGPYYELSKCGDYSSFKEKLAEFENLDGLTDFFFLAGLCRLIVPDVPFERWVKNLRRYLLENIAAGEKLFLDENDMERVVCALAGFCFAGNYVIGYSGEEEAVLRGLEQKIKDAGGDPALADLACYGCYKPVYSLPNAKEIAAQFDGGEEHPSQVLRTQIEDYLAQQDIKDEIEALVKIEGETSRAVREQYEEFPYPFWDVVSKTLSDPLAKEHLKGKKAEILIAGCGTGRESAMMANVFPDAQITAVDLSKTSLAYAIFKARQFGLENINFYQADIMELASLEDWQGRFDYIASSGVLHHMKDPKAGWKVLCGLLKDEGLMSIALYSRHARWAVNAGREVIKAHNIGFDFHSIRDFRDNIGTYLDDKTVEGLSRLRDYYVLYQFRDLLFHVQEHQFDLLQIRDHLDELGLEFLKFFPKKSVMDRYAEKYGGLDPEARSLVFWDDWEKDNPDTFIAMYNFWCKKAGGG